jgi:PilZ domain
MSAATATVPSLERRRERRIAVHLPILVRGTDRSGEWFEDRTSCENLCRGGVAFATRYALHLGARVEINIPTVSSPGMSESEFSSHGRVVHLKPGRINQDTIVGVEFTGPHFHRVFVSESSR